MNTPDPNSDTTTETAARPADSDTEPSLPTTPQTGRLPREADQDEASGDAVEGNAPGQ